MSPSKRTLRDTTEDLAECPKSPTTRRVRIKSSLPKQMVAPEPDQKRQASGGSTVPLLRLEGHIERMKLPDCPNIHRLESLRYFQELLGGKLQVSSVTDIAISALYLIEMTLSKEIETAISEEVVVGCFKVVYRASETDLRAELEGRLGPKVMEEVVTKVVAGAVHEDVVLRHLALQSLIHLLSHDKSNVSIVNSVLKSPNAITIIINNITYPETPEILESSVELAVKLCSTSSFDIGHGKEMVLLVSKLFNVISDPNYREAPWNESIRDTIITVAIKNILENHACVIHRLIAEGLLKRLVGALHCTCDSTRADILTCLKLLLEENEENTKLALHGRLLAGLHKVLDSGEGDAVEKTCELVAAISQMDTCVAAINSLSNDRRFVNGLISVGNRAKWKTRVKAILLVCRICVDGSDSHLKMVLHGRGLRLLTLTLKKKVMDSSLGTAILMALDRLFAVSKHENFPSLQQFEELRGPSSLNSLRENSRCADIDRLASRILDKFFGSELEEEVYAQDENWIPSPLAQGLLEKFASETSPSPLQGQRLANSFGQVQN